jgi:hypothetical protein
VVLRIGLAAFRAAGFLALFARPAREPDLAFLVPAAAFALALVGTVGFAVFTCVFRGLAGFVDGLLKIQLIAAVTSSIGLMPSTTRSSPFSR